MKIVCIKNIEEHPHNLTLTIGKSYQLIDTKENDENILIFDDKNLFCAAPKTWFISLKEFRKKKFERILNCYK
jgi:hypothetical protein